MYSFSFPLQFTHQTEYPKSILKTHKSSLAYLQTFLDPMAQFKNLLDTLKGLLKFHTLKEEAESHMNILQRSFTTSPGFWFGVSMWEASLSNWWTWSSSTIHMLTLLLSATTKQAKACLCFLHKFILLQPPRPYILPPFKLYMYAFFSTIY